MKIWRVDVERTTTTWIQAETKEAAEDDAAEMSFNATEFYFEEETHVYAGGTPRPEELVWTGGPDGDWVEATVLAHTEESG